MTKTNEIMNWLTALVLAAAVFVTASCGGGGATVPLPQQSDKPMPGTADLSGQLLQAGGERVISAAGDGLPGVFVTLIDTLTGGKVGADITDNLGKFEFEGVPAGDNYLIKLEFKSTEDLDGDGRLDEIELFFPVSLADQAVAQMLQEIGVADSDGDGVLDALEVEINLTDDSGRVETSSSQHRRRGGETRTDSDDDGSFDDEPGMDDSDGDGLADAPSPAAGMSGEAMELEVRGVIEELTETTITVGGVTFELTPGTEWKINDQHVSAASFSAGMFVKVEGFPNASGGWTAHEVEDEGADDNGGIGGDDSGIEREVRGVIEELTETSITVAGVTFALTAGTEWEINDVDASPADFAVGMFVKAEGFADGNGGWIAHEVETEDPSFSGGSDDDDSDDDSGDDSDDDSGDDDSGDDDDDDDDNSDSGSGDDDDDDDNSGSGSGDDD